MQLASKNVCKQNTIQNNLPNIFLGNALSMFVKPQEYTHCVLVLVLVTMHVKITLFTRKTLQGAFKY